MASPASIAFDVHIHHHPGQPMTTAADIAPNIDHWITYDPIDHRYEPHTSEADALDTLTQIMEACREQAGDDGWPENTEAAAAYALVPIAYICLTETAHKGDGTEAGEICEERGWDFMAEAKIAAAEQTIAGLVAEVIRLRAALEARGGER